MGQPPLASDLVTHVWGATSEVECDYVEPGGWTGSACVSTFHSLGVEIQDMPGSSGDGDGLCEAGEPCLRVRNYGAYQGHGALVSLGDFDFGSAGSFQFYEYEFNGR